MVFLMSLPFCTKKQAQDSRSTFKIAEIENLFLMNIFNDMEYPLQDGIKILDIDGTVLRLTDLIKENQKLILFISNTICEQCIFSELNLAIKELKGVKKEDIIVLSSYSNPNSLKLMREKYSIENKCYGVIRDKAYPDFFQNGSSPLVFLLNQNLSVENIFLPNRKLPQISKAYYSKVSELFFSRYKKDKMKNKGIYFKHTIIDIGKLEYGKDTTVYFTFTNKMEEPLVISNITADCGCTTVDWERIPVASGESSQIKIKYSSKTKGRFMKSIMVKSNAINSPIKIMLKGES